MRRKKTLANLALLLAGSAFPVSGATLLAGWDTWSEVTADTWNATLLTSVTGQGKGTVSSGAWANFANATVDNAASNDGTWGSVGSGSGIPAPSTSVASSTEATTLANGGNGYIDFTITSTIGQDLVLSSFNFDSARVRASSAKNWAVSVVSGPLTVGSVATGALNTSNTFQSMHLHSPNEFDVDLTGLADHTLEGGQTVVFRLQYTGGAGSGGGNNVFLDNVAIFGDAVPEPSSTLLLGLGGLALLRRRRQ